MQETEIAHSQYIFAALFLGCASFGVALQVVGGILVRVGTLPESYSKSVVYLNNDKLLELVIALERELVVDSGNSLINTANLLLYSSVIASLGISFPRWTAAVSVAFFVSIVIVVMALAYAATQLIGKRNRQQNLFDLVAQVGSGLGTRAYLVARHPSFEYWRSLTRLCQAVEVLRQVVYTSRLYWAKEPET